MARSMSPAMTQDPRFRLPLAADLQRTRPPAQESRARMTVCDAVVLSLLVTMDITAWCFVALLGLQALVG